MTLLHFIVFCLFYSWCFGFTIGLFLFHFKFYRKPLPAPSFILIDDVNIIFYLLFSFGLFLCCCISFSGNLVELFYSDEGSLDSPSDHPPMSPKVMQSPEEIANIQNGDRSTSGVKIRRYFHIVLALSYIYTKPLIDI